jgi:hypothetical protein
LFFSWATWIQCTPFHFTSLWSILKLCIHLCLFLPTSLFYPGYATTPLYDFSECMCCNLHTSFRITSHLIFQWTKTDEFQIYEGLDQIHIRKACALTVQHRKMRTDF